MFVSPFERDLFNNQNLQLFQKKATDNQPYRFNIKLTKRSETMILHSLISSRNWSVEEVRCGLLVVVSLTVAASQKVSLGSLRRQLLSI